LNVRTWNVQRNQGGTTEIIPFVPEWRRDFCLKVLLVKVSKFERRLEMMVEKIIRKNFGSVQHLLARLPSLVEIYFHKTTSNSVRRFKNE